MVNIKERISYDYAINRIEISRESQIMIFLVKYAHLNP